VSEAHPFRFEAFADAASAQAAFEAAFPPGSAIEPALQALVGMGAHCKSVGPGRVACRYVEQLSPLAGWCWHVAVERNANAVERVRIELAMTGI
jgi:hypothetical protein